MVTVCQLVKNISTFFSTRKFKIFQNSRHLSLSLTRSKLRHPVSRRSTLILSMSPDPYVLYNFHCRISYPVPIPYIVQKDRSQSEALWNVPLRIKVLRYWLVCNSPKHQPGGHPLSDARYFLFIILTAIFHTWTQSPPSQREDTPHRDDRDALSTAADTFSLLQLLLLVLLVIIKIIIVFSGAVTVSLKIFIPQLESKPIINTLLAFSLLLTPYLHSVQYSLLPDIQSIIDSLLTFPHDEIKYITPKTGREWYIKLHERTQQPFVSNLLNFPTWDFLKKIAQSVYRRGCELDDPRIRIPVRAIAFCVLQNVRTGSGTHTATWSVCTGLLHWE